MITILGAERSEILGFEQEPDFTSGSGSVFQGT